MPRSSSSLFHLPGLGFGPIKIRRIEFDALVSHLGHVRDCAHADRSSIALRTEYSSRPTGTEVAAKARSDKGSMADKSQKERAGKGVRVL